MLAELCLTLINALLPKRLCEEHGCLMKNLLHDDDEGVSESLSEYSCCNTEFSLKEAPSVNFTPFISMNMLDYGLASTYGALACERNSRPSEADHSVSSYENRFLPVAVLQLRESINGLVQTAGVEKELMYVQ